MLDGEAALDGSGVDMIRRHWSGELDVTFLRRRPSSKQRKTRRDQKSRVILLRSAPGAYGHQCWRRAGRYFLSLFTMLLSL